jgi:RimJ/RimL family protein N-acetyltransferase
VLLERLELNERAFRERGHGLVAIIERASGRFVGRIGLRYWPQFDETEVGWALRPEDWGKGYATEAAQACIDWGFREFDFPYLTAMIQPANVRSIRVAERLGMTQLRRDVLLDIPVIVYCLPSPRGPAAHP